jgi:hypothetical protein
LTRRNFLLAAGVLGVSVAGYARCWESRALRVARHSIPVSSGRSRVPLRLLHLSDLHASSVVPLGFIAKAVELGLRSEPDLICVTGDFITGTCDDTTSYASVLSKLSGRAPTFACLGNHDGGQWAGIRGGYDDTRRVRELLARSEIDLLHNAARLVSVRDWKLRLVGVGDLWAEELDAAAAFGSAAPDGAVTILLSHNPDSKSRLASQAWELMLCGHTHGGQLRLPLLGTPFAPVRDKAFVEGLHRWKDRWIHITRGVGNLLGFRFNCRPEVSVLTLE